MVLDINMRALCVILLCYTSLQLKCDKKQISAHVGGEFILICRYDTNPYLYSKKYWCRGNARETCEVLVDSERQTQTECTHRSQVVDARKRGLFVKVRQLQYDDSGVYWVGIDKPFADIMTSVEVVITEVPVSKPSLWPLSSLVHRPTCWGQPVIVRCESTRGTAITYTWYNKSTVLHNSPDLKMHCGTVKDGGDYFCVTSNSVSSQRSDVLSVQVLLSADSSCIYVIDLQGQPAYDCADRMRTTTPATTSSPSSCINQTFTKINTNFSFPINQSSRDHFSSDLWLWTRLPFWYTLLRWIFFAFLLIFLFIVLLCTKEGKKSGKRKRRVRSRHLAR